MEMNFCRRCGQKLEHVRQHIYKCPAGHTLFASANPAVGVFILTPNGEVMLSVRGREPRKGMLDSFGGFVDDDETSEQTVARELNEELGLNPEDYEPVTYICSGAGTYPYEGEVLPVVANFYYTRLTGSKDPQPDDDVAGIRTVPLHEVDMAEVHDEDVRLGIRQLQKIIDNTAAAEKE